MGHLDPSAGSIEVSGEGSGRVYKQFGLFILFGVLTGVVAALFGPRAAMVLWFGLNLLMPGAIMILAVTDSLGKALNPVWYAMLLRSIGWAYLLMVAFMFLLTEGASAALGLLQGVLPGLLVWSKSTPARPMPITLITNKSERSQMRLAGTATREIPTVRRQSALTKSRSAQQDAEELLRVRRNPAREQSQTNQDAPRTIPKMLSTNR